MAFLELLKDILLPRPPIGLRLMLYYSVMFRGFDSKLRSNDATPPFEVLLMSWPDVLPTEPLASFWIRRTI